MSKALALLLPALAVLLLVGCGSGGLPSASGDERKGGQLFASKCGGCHTMAVAGSTGTLGPNLDAAFGPDKLQRIKQDTIEAVVLDQIRVASAPMPQNLVRGQDAIDVAAYVAANAGAQGPEAKPNVTNSTDGKTIFTSQCASCHTLAAAGAKGTVGPNLDELMPPFAIAERQVINGGSVMPAFKGRLTMAQIIAVATYVARET